MSGDTSNARLWADADVYIAFDTTTAAPADGDTPFGVGWDLVGLLDGDDGFTESRESDETDHFAWGGILIRTGRRNYKETHSFTALEWNVTTERLYRPGSDALVAGSGIWKVALVPERVKVAFETIDGDITKRLIAIHEAEVQVDGDVDRNESDISALNFMATIYPNADGELWTVQESTPAP